jgi:hypothetical protein
MDKRKPSQSRFAQTVIEQNVAPPPEEKLLVAAPMPRAQTPIGMPAPPAVHEEEEERQSYDNVEHVLEMQKLERERAQLLAQLQDAKQENRLLRETTPTVVFPPPPSIPPAAETKIIVSDPPVDIKALQKAVLKSRAGRAAITLGILAALCWNAYNTVRVDVPIKKAEAAQARIAQTEQLSAEEIKNRAIESERNYQRWRAVYCYIKQLRGASARQGLDLPSLPPGGVKALRLGDEDPNRPGPPRFVAEEVCPEFPALPPESVAR